MPELRTRVLDNRQHGQGLWRSDWTGALYRYQNHCWWVHLADECLWERCVDSLDCPARWTLVGQSWETFIRVGEVIQ
ncbi:hypothetical protein SEA_FLUDD_155 [Mycobacterium phage Fludd]|uniref:Uncharacterized protein n=4 Tax=Bixzunavirus TaxID=680114 RepID=A0A411CCF8_9CAUD|nr:hypothetical protein KHO62_gp162 [Mycobacterium phage NoodleTree]AFL46839.1 hypothetical protein AVA3_153 [Mycobacterium phage Ava3]AID18229.1 hypothetical protein PBI_WILLIS_153 [Mycobacterium phage Willis]ALF51239.1 hypothetical protein SEA_ERNIEJ_147 [Mycobacterium phage ErnieJ]ATN88255.1 hypothetical protein SEA_DAFFODIL_157 [Mycobacterium phage Daffodil]AWY10093.1 hypothetical protein PARKTD_153 [Mycobacterium phage ParkTD]AXN53972.1 hypothetical protein SEA_RABINOVISH_152 [Mycobacter